MNRPFYSKADNYEQNILEGSEIGAYPAMLSAPDGPEHGIVIRSGHRIRSVIPVADALRVANQIADAVEALERGAA